MDSAKQDSQTPSFTFPDDGGRPYVEEYGYNPKFRPNDDVYVQDPVTKEWKGPFTVSSLEGGRYKLQDSRGREVNNGQLFEEACLKLYNLFE
ncbi:uncharacterized protein F4817DRAFT_70088 [Daldinia loculata]|uniref:uncharacterized protein n=1 Tax=Daldinia loculata TaxID=103429 RepID=UPI0020C1CFE2|nr:uncharacterized protein F4817DRAFT_70088 [Daldinia loculata]KAI1648291.1 hypothetical protein F4817DRAFT_70088 [Daldinia loculata]